MQLPRVFVISIEFVIHKHSSTECRNFRPLWFKPKDIIHGLQLNIGILISIDEKTKNSLVSS